MVWRPAPLSALSVDFENMSVQSFQDTVDFKQYLFEYRHDGSEWGIEIAASSPEDAKKRIQALAWAHYKGRVAATIPLPSNPFRSLLRIVGAAMGFGRNHR